MRSNRLQLNTAKTEVFWSTSSRRLHLLPVSPIRVGSDQVMPVSVVCNLSICVRWCFIEVARLKDCSCFNCRVFVTWFRAPFYGHWFHLSLCSSLTMVMQRWLAFRPILPSGCSQCWILLLGLCFPHRGMTTSCHSWHSCTGWRCKGASSLSWLFWYTVAYTRQLRRTLLRNSISHLLTRLVVVSALPLHHLLLCDAPVFQPLAIELFRSLLPDCGTLPLNVTSASSISVVRKRLKTHFFSHSFPESSVVPVQWLCHFGHYNRSCYLLTYLLVGFKTWRTIVIIMISLRLCICWYIIVMVRRKWQVSATCWQLWSWYVCACLPMMSSR